MGKIIESVKSIFITCFSLKGKARNLCLIKAVIILIGVTILFVTVPSFLSSCSGTNVKEQRNIQLKVECDDGRGDIKPDVGGGMPSIKYASNKRICGRNSGICVSGSGKSVILDGYHDVK